MTDEFDVAVDPQDIKWVHPDEATTNDEIWTALMWGNSRDKAFLKRLKTYRTISDPGTEIRIESREGIIVGDRKKSQPKLLDRLILKTKDFPTDSLIYLNTEALTTNGEVHTHSKDSTNFDAFSCPQLIIKQSWRKPTSRFQARLLPDTCREGILCSQSYLTVHVPPMQRGFIEAACLSYNSALAVYFLLLTSGRFASYRPEPLVEELKRVPIPEPRPKLLHGLERPEDIDLRTCEAFGFKNAEWVLVDDLFRITLPDFKGDKNSPGRKRTRRTAGVTEEPELRHYCEYFIRVLKAGFGQDKSITATIFQETNNNRLPYRLVAFELNGQSKEQVSVEPLGSLALLAELNRLNRIWLRSRTIAGGSIYYQRVARIYDHRGKTPTIFLLKPDAYRHWTRSMGLYDADEVAADFLRWQVHMDEAAKPE